MQVKPLLIFFLCLFKGFFINEIDRECFDAYEKLRKMDKILDIDGIDFTRIKMDEACKIMDNVGAVFSVMVSRV